MDVRMTSGQEAVPWPAGVIASRGIAARPEIPPPITPGPITNASRSRLPEPIRPRAPASTLAPGYPTGHGKPPIYGIYPRPAYPACGFAHTPYPVAGIPYPLCPSSWPPGTLPGHGDEHHTRWGQGPTGPNDLPGGPIHHISSTTRKAGGAERPVGNEGEALCHATPNRTPLLPLRHPPGGRQSQ